jgi:exopolysaccharide production protein ExoZ
MSIPYATGGAAGSRNETPDRAATYESIQALRGVAAILVTLFHAFAHFDPTESCFRVGNAGVDIFFVISGFIMWSTAARHAPSPSTFLRHRLIRLVPLYAIFTLLLAAGWAVLPSAFPHMRPPTPGHVLLSLAFIPHGSPDGQGFPVLAQGWTLNFEMAFYLLFALALALPRGWRANALAAALLAMPLLGLAVSDAQARLFPPLVLLSPLLVEFLAGIAIARMIESDWRLNAVASWVCLVAGALALVLLPLPGRDDDWARIALFGAPAALIVAGAVSLEVGARRFRVGRLPLLLGASSYSLYLSHSFTLSVVGKAFPGAAPQWLYVAIATSASAAVGIAVYRLLEQPLLKAMRGGRPQILSMRTAQL